MKLLVLHGPNMNLLGVRSAQKGENITLDKINRHIRRYIRDKNIEIKIIQTHSEVKAVSYIQNNRNNFDGLILTPGAWNESGYILQARLAVGLVTLITDLSLTETLTSFCGICLKLLNNSLAFFPFRIE